MSTYKPRPEQAAILDRAWQHVQGVPYAVTARWVFYRLLEEVYGGRKEAYKTQFLPLMSRARKAFYGPWRPDSLVDESRVFYLGGDGHSSEVAWRKAVRENLTCNLDHWASQPAYMELWFEAKAMRAQFEFYAPGFTLRPFGGDPSISYKWEAAAAIRRASQRYAVPVHIYYFGDRDDKGESIALAALQNIQEWAGVPFSFERVGLTVEQATDFGLSSSIDKPDAYQWEALDDDQARELIKPVTEQVDTAAWAKVDDEEEKATMRLREQLEALG